MDFAKILKTLEDGVKFVENLAPLATAIGGPIVGNIVSTVKTVTDIADNIVTRAAEAEHVFRSEDQAEISSLVSRLASINDQLAEAIRNS